MKSGTQTVFKNATIKLTFRPETYWFGHGNKNNLSLRPRVKFFLFSLMKAFFARPSTIVWSYSI